MTVSLSNEKKDGLKLKIYKVLSIKKPTIRDLASVTGSILSTFPAAPYGKMHYRQLERFKHTALQHDDDFESQLPSLPQNVHDELKWWLSDLDKCIRPVTLPEIDYTIETDASHLGWGASNGIQPIGNRREEAELPHINFLQLRAVWLALNSYFRNSCNARQVKILSDNFTAILYVNNMGGKLEPSNDLTKIICISKNLWITACFIPGTDNITADWKSRKFNDDIEWQLAPSVFKQVISLLGFNPEIDLFATYLNHQLDKYVA